MSRIELGDEPGAWGYWMRRRFVVEDGFIQPVLQTRVRIYDPFAPKLEFDEEGVLVARQDLPDDDEPLAMALANVDGSRPRRIEAWVNCWGVLGVSSGEDVTPLRERVEAVEDFAAEALLFREVAQTFLVGNPTSPDPEWVKVLSQKVTGVHPALFKSAGARGLALTGGHRGEHFLSYGIKDGASVLVPLGEVATRWSFGNLLTAAYWQLHLLVQAGQPPKRCENPTCERLFVLTRPDRRFCSNRCGNAVRQRERRASEPKDPGGE